MKKAEIIKLLQLKNASVERNKKYKIELLIKLVRKSKQSYYNVRLTPDGFINLGDLSEYLTAYYIFDDCSHVVHNGAYDYYDNGKCFEFKSLILNQPHAVQRISTIIVLVITAKIKGFYRINESDSVNLLNKEINQADIIKYGTLIKPL